MATERRLNPNWAVSPGEILEEALDERGMSQAELARRMDRPVKTINEIVKAKTAITAETALQLEIVLDVPARFWMNLERQYAEALARDRAEESRKAPTAKRTPGAGPFIARSETKRTRGPGNRKRCFITAAFC